MQNNILIEIYLLGFNLEESSEYSKGSLEHKAYRLGQLHSVEGVDYLTEQEILKLIRDEGNN